MSNIIENIKIERNEYYFEDLTHEGSEEDPYLFPTISHYIKYSGKISLQTIFLYKKIMESEEGAL